MAVANPCLLKEWAEWKTGVEEGRKKRRKWRKWVSRWVKVQEEEESEDTDSEEVDLSEEEGENEAGEKGKEEEEEEEMEVKEEDLKWLKGSKKGDVEEEEEGKTKENEEVDQGEGKEEVEREVKEEDEEREETEEEEEGGESGQETGLQEGGGEEEGWQMSEADERVDIEEEEEEEVEREVKEEEEEGEETEEEEGGESGQEMGLQESTGGGEEEGWQMSEADERVDIEEEEEVGRELKEEVEEGEETEEEEEGGESGQETGLQEGGGEEEGWQMSEANERVDIEEDMERAVNEGNETEEEEEEEGESEGEGEAEDSEEEGEEEVRQAREQKQMRRIQVDNIQPHQESTAQGDEDEEDNLLDSAISMHSEGLDVTGPEHDMDTSEKLTREEEKVSDSRAAQELHYDLENLEEEESTDDEEAEYPPGEDEDGYDDDEVKVYCKDGHPTDVFLKLNEFRNSSLLTDLTLRTEDGRSFHVHSAVLAAVSSLICKNLSRRVGSEGAGEREADTSAGVRRWSVPLHPEVGRVGLEAIIEFAYTGLIPCLNKDNIDQVRAAALTLDAPRVLNLCTEEEQKSVKTGKQKKKEGTPAAQQLMINLQSIQQLWADMVSCDVILEALGASFHAHRVILAASSDYFRGMFTLGMKESHQSCVTLPFLLASELEALIGCSYSGALTLSWSCAFEITSTALQLQHQPAFSLCLDFLQKEIHPHSCLDVVSFAEAYEMTHLLEAADDFVTRQFQKVACTSKFKDLPARQLMKYLNSRSLCVPSELVLFKAVVAWIQARPKKRLRLAKRLMKTIHFPLMTYKEFQEVQSQNMWSDHSLAELYEAVFEDFCSNETTLQNQCRIYQPKESLVLIGGDQTSEDLATRSISSELWFGNSLMSHAGIKKAMEWRRLGELPESARFSHEVAVLKGQLYVLGGKMYYGIGDTLNSVYRYDPFKNSWERLADLLEKRCYFSVVVLNGKIYAIGGRRDPDSDYIDSVEQYCPTTNCWSYTWPLDLQLSGHVARVSQGHIFVSGGRNRDYSCLASMIRYHPEAGSTYLANMAQPRANHCMETLGECLYVAGGTTIGHIITISDQLRCEMYSPAADSWTAFPSLPVPHVGAGSAVLEGKFYVLGGYSQEDCSDTNRVHRYDTATQRWENMGKMPGPNNDIRASLLCLPQHIRS